MRTLLRRAAATSAALGTLVAGAVALAPAAAAADCNTTTFGVDDRSYTGPYSDNWTVKAQMCSYRSGGYIYGYAQLSWDIPWAVDHSNHRSFDGAAFRVYLKKHRSGAPDPIRRYHTFYFTDRMDAGSGSYRTPTIRYPISKWALADGAWKLNWDNDGDGYKHYGVTASGLE